MTAILGISAFYHDSAAALVIDGHIIAAAQEERFTRKKHDATFPQNAIRYCLQEANITITDIDYVVFYDKPLIKFERLLETYLSYAPKGIQSFIKAIPIWLKEKLYLKKILKQELTSLIEDKKTTLPPLLFTEHHQSHAASAFFPSPFNKAAVMCLDGVGEWATSSVWVGEGNKLTPQWEINFPHSLGLLYSAFTYYTGFKVNSGEYKLMGLAPYGEPVYVDIIKKHLIDIKDDGSFHLNMDYFNYATGLTMTNKKFDNLFNGPPRKSESEITQKEMDLARSIQVVTEEIILKLAHSVKKETGCDALCLAGGVALNCVANGRLLREGAFDKIWIQPAAGDAGGSLGAALAIWYQYLENPRNKKNSSAADDMQGSYLGPSFNNNEIKNYLDNLEAPYTTIEDPALYTTVADLINQGNVIGWFQGRMEFGPRALGNRSIIGDPRNSDMQSTMNLKIKYRESFRPFAPAIKRENVEQWFQHNTDSPYMLMVAPIADNKKIAIDDTNLTGLKKLKVPRSQIPAVTHVDGSSRIQTVHKETNPHFYALLDAFEKKSQCPVLVNTSFNVRGEPIVNTPEDAYRCFMRTDMDYLVLENQLLSKKDQPAFSDKEDWRQTFALD